MKEATEFGNSQSAKENDDALEAIKKAGKTEIITLTPEQDEAMRKAMMPVYKEVAVAGRSALDRRIPERDGPRPDELKRIGPVRVLVLLGLITYIPGISLWLPRLLGTI